MSLDQSSDRPSTESAQDIQVRLKPLFGVDPKYYLAALYLILTLAVLFGLLVWPGLANPGTRVTVTSTPPGAAVFYGGKHYGTTPVTAFFPEGKATLEVSKPGFQAVSQDYSSGNNLVASLVLPRTDRVEFALKAVSDEALAAYYRTEVGRWSLALPFTSDYRFPPLFTRFAADARAAGWSADRIQSFLLDQRAAVADPWMYADYAQALGLWTTAPTDLEAQYEAWKPLVDGDDRLALWLLANQTKPQKDRETTEPSDWFQARTKGFQASLAPAVTPSFGPAPGALRTALGGFRGVGPARFLWGSQGTGFSLPVEPPFALPVVATTEAFWIADAEVTQAQYAAFVAAVPRWAPSGAPVLAEAGLVDDQYLSGWEGPQAPAPQQPVAWVSWYAAQAYVDWLNASGQVPAGKKAVLPTDQQWEAAARSGASMVGQGVWEWTASTYTPGDSLVGLPATGPGYAHSLKGGVADVKPAVIVGQRAGWPSHRATGSLGFRVALVASTGTP